MQESTTIAETQQAAENPLDEDKLWDAGKLQEYSGWSRFHISRLCTRGVLPFIPGKPTKFVPEDVKKAIRNMQVGGQYGKRKARKKL